ncbi:MAG: hypothetical protein KAU38_09545 [Desulfobacterales bacterium]|nr:hypothetical protein [Desulfobacterales bacterium]
MGGLKGGTAERGGGASASRGKLAWCLELHRFSRAFSRVNRQILRNILKQAVDGYPPVNDAKEVRQYGQEAQGSFPYWQDNT